jgi:hypothetical protein
VITDTLALVLLVSAALLATLELLLSQAWAPICWAGPSIRFRRRAEVSAESVVAAVGARSLDDLFTGFAARQIRPGFVALREHAWQRHPHLPYYPALRAHFRVETLAVSLEVFPAWSTLALLAACGVALFAAWPFRLFAIAGFLVLAFGTLVQTVRFASLLRKVALHARAPR